MLKVHGRLACQVCNFDFAAVYGEIGENFIECHHRVALSVSSETTTSLRDLAVVCSNCHRMLHRSQPWPSVDELRQAVAAHAGEST